MKARLCRTLLVSIAIAETCFALHPAVKIAPAPAWAMDTPVADTLSFGKLPVSTGYYYVVLNCQENIAARQAFRHHAIKLLTSEGVQEMSDVSATFDPAYQTLIFHSIAVIRNGVRIDKLRSKDIKVIQREENMDRCLYDGRLTAIANLTDIRVGDVVDYSFSLCGENPIMGGMYDNKIYLQYRVPIEFYTCRLMVPDKRNIRFKYNNGASPPEKSVGNGFIAYTWTKWKLQAVIPDINTPDWYDPFPSVSVSEYDSWGRVVAQFAPLYAASPETRDQLKHRLKDVIRGTSEDSVILQSIRFVQDHIRYLGFENGFNSHKPTAPLQLLDQRFGDCKAKAFLLCEILKSHNIEAYPLLVGSDAGYAAKNDLPTPHSFDHCTVQFMHNGRPCYVDPTISCQGGDLEHLYFPYYRYGLLLKEGVASIDSIPFSNYHRIRARETFILDTVGGPAELTVVTTYAGGAADRCRYEFNTANGESVEKQYLDFYSKLYQNIRAVDKIKVIDAREHLNEFIVEERYKIDNLWRTTDTTGKVLAADFYPLSMDTYVSNKKSPHRTMPYAVNYPLDYEQKTVVNLPEKWTITDDSSCIRTAAFLYTYSKRYRNDAVTIVHTYKTFQDFVPESKADEFIHKHNDIMDKLPFTLTYKPGVTQNGSAFKFSWMAGLIALLVTALCGWLAVRVYYRYDIGPAKLDEEPLELGGWLFLFAIGVSFAPFRLLYDLYHSPEFLNSLIWSNLFDFNNSSKNMLLGFVIFFEMIFNSAKLVFCVLLVFLFFKKRTLFPAFAIAFYLAALIFLLADTWVVKALNGSELNATDVKKAYADIWRSVIGIVIWVPYLLVSKRVKQTFIVRAPQKHNASEPQPPPIGSLS